jgi:transaldolase
MTDPLTSLTEAGVSIWLDDLSRDRLTSGSLADLLANDHVVGVTTNPTIFARAITSGSSYDAHLRGLAARGVEVGETLRALTTRDVRWACSVHQDPGRAAIANARLTYQRYERVFSSPRWELLRTSST